MHAAQAADPGLALLAADVEGQQVAQLQLQAAGQFRLHRHTGDFIFGGQRLPPVATRQCVALGQFGCPGQAEVALHGALACRILADHLLHRLVVDSHQAAGCHRVQRCRGGIDLLQVLGEGLAIIRQDVQGKMVGCILGQLRLPGVEQFRAQQRDQGHGQQDQAEGQGLAGSGHGVAQQLAQPQAPGQWSPGQQLAQAAQTEQQQAAEQQCGDQAAYEQCEGEQQVEAQAPHDQAQGEKGRAVHQPAAGRYRQQVAA